jgi:O-antigen ligase
MKPVQEKLTSVIRIDDVEIGPTSSRPSSAVFFLLCLIPAFATIVFGAVDNATWVILTVLWLAVILFWLADTWKGSAILLNPSPLVIPLAGMVLIGLIQLLPFGNDGTSVLNRAASRSLSLDPYATRLFVTRLVVYLMYFAACLSFINNEKRLKRAVIFIVVFGAAMAFFGILQRLTNPETIYWLRSAPQAIPFGSFVNQHHFAAFMQMPGGLAFALIFGKEMPRDKKILLAMAVLIMGVAAVFTGSRGGLLGFVAVLAFVAAANFLSQRAAGDSLRPKLMMIAAAGLVISIFGAALLLGGSEGLLRGTGIANADADISSGRIHFWQIAGQIFLAHPFLGAGLDAFGVAFTRFDTGSGVFRVEQAHNEYLQMLADAGVVGLVCVAVFVYLLLRKGIGIVSTAAQGFRRASAVGALGGCVGILIHSFVDFPLRTPSNAFFFLLLAAIATVPVAGSHNSRRRRSST